MQPRTHIVLVPGFAGFDALGSLDYYTGVTEVLREGPAGGYAPFEAPVTVHYFPNLPTASIAIRAKALLEWLVKWFQRGIIRRPVGGQRGDYVHLVGHSTGGMDIKRLMVDLLGKVQKGEPLFGIPPKEIRDSLCSIQFLSTPHHGTTIAHRLSRNEMVIRGGFAAMGHVSAFAGGWGVSGVAQGLAWMKQPHGLFRAILESAEHCNAQVDDGLKKAEARGVYFEALRWLQNIAADMGAIKDLDPYGPGGSESLLGLETPSERKATEFQTSVRAAQGPEDRAALLTKEVPESISLASQPELQAALKDAYQDVALRSLVTVAQPVRGAPCYDPFKFFHGMTAEKLPEPSNDFEKKNKAQLDKTYSLQTLQSSTDRGAPQRLRIGPSDNDGIVNSVSMVWPDEARSFLVPGDHGDIIGHFEDGKPGGVDGHSQYDLLRSDAGFNRARFLMVWRSVREFVRVNEPVTALGGS